MMSQSYLFVNSEPELIVKTSTLV